MPYNKKMPDYEKEYCCDHNLSREQEVALGRAALVVIRDLTSRATSSDLLEIGCVIDCYIEGFDDFSIEEQEELDSIESRLGLMAVWVDPEHVWVRRSGSINAVPVEWGWAGSLDG